MCMCNKCGKMCGVLLLVFGVLFLLQDLNIWNYWGINWYSIAFLLLGFAMLGNSGCKSCQDLKKK